MSKQGKTQSLPKSDVSQQSHVTFPFHLQVAKGLQNGLTFGSFDSNFVKEVSSNNGASGGDDSNFESSDGTGDDEREPSPTTNGIPGVASARFVTEMLSLYILSALVIVWFQLSETMKICTYKFNFGNGKVLSCDIVVEVYSVFCWPIPLTLKVDVCISFSLP